MAKQSKTSPTDKELLELGKKVQAFYDYGYVNRKQALSFALVRGIATGLGIFIGGTIIISLLIWGLSLFEEVPLIGDFVIVVRSSLEK